jgi:phospholipid/cholesterol/gamma-HCH transport system permease protein
VSQHGTIQAAADSHIACRASVERHGERGRLSLSGCFELDNASFIEHELSSAKRDLESCMSVDLTLAGLQHIDGAGAVLLARLIDRLEASGQRVQVIEEGNPEAARLIALYRERRGEAPEGKAALGGPLARLGVVVATLPNTLADMASFVGRFVAAMPKSITTPRSVNWRSIPDLLQSIGADAFPVAGAANFLVGLIVGFLGISQLARFGAIRYVPELLVVAHFRELGPLVTAIVVAGRSGAGLASELGTMKVSEEIDALRTMGFDPMRWLVIPCCVALCVSVPLITWLGFVLAVLGGMLATVTLTEMTPYIFLVGISNVVTPAHVVSGLVKTPFLALAIGLIACAQGLATRGGAAAVGARTTMAVVASMFAVIVISTIFSVFYTLVGI